MGNTTLRNIAIVGGIRIIRARLRDLPGVGRFFCRHSEAGTAEPDSIAQLLRYMGTIENPYEKPIRGSGLYRGPANARRVRGMRLKKDNVGDYLLNRMWIPVRDELSEVVRRGGSVTSATSVWSSVPNLYKQETPTTFHQGMERYVNQRAQAAALVASVTATEESRQQQEIEQQKLLFTSRELLEDARKAIYFIPGSEAAVKRAEAARPRPSAQQTRPAATTPSAGSTVGTAPAAPASRSAQAQTATPVRTISWRPDPSRPAPASMRTEESPRTPSAAQTTVPSCADSPENIGYSQDPRTRRRTAYST